MNRKSKKLFRDQHYQDLQMDLDPSGRVITIGTIVLYAGWVIGPVFGASVESLCNQV